MIKIFQKKGLYTLCIQGVKNVQNLSKFKQKNIFSRGKHRCTYCVSKMSNFDKFLGFFLTIFQDVYICVSTENFEMHTANLPVGCAEKK